MDPSHLNVACAYHESGHAVVAHCLGIQLRSIVVQGDSGRTCRVPGPVDSDDLLAMLQAGGVAQSWFDVDTIDPFKTLVDDQAQIDELVSQLATNKRRQRRLRRRAEARAKR